MIRGLPWGILTRQACRTSRFQGCPRAPPTPPSITAARPIPNHVEAMTASAGGGGDLRGHDDRREQRWEHNRNAARLQRLDQPQLLRRDDRQGSPGDGPDQTTDIDTDDDPAHVSIPAVQIVPNDANIQQGDPLPATFHYAVQVAGTANAPDTSGLADPSASITCGTTAADSSTPGVYAIYCSKPCALAHLKDASTAATCVPGTDDVFVDPNGSGTYLLEFEAGALTISSTTAAYVGHVRFVQQSGRLTVRWQARAVREVLGYRVYAGKRALGRRMIAARGDGRYVYRARYEGAGPFSLRVVLRDGREVVGGVSGE